MRPAHLTYQEILAQAKTCILHQDDAVSRLAIVLYYHLKFYHQCQSALEVAEVEKLFDQNPLPNPKEFVADITPKSAPIGAAPIFLLGKTGSGKTHLVQELCKIAGVNFVSVNTTHLSNAGYKGFTLADVGEMIVKKAQNTTQALFSVVFFDEFDKLFMPMGENQAGYQRGLATELLTILEGSSHFPIKDKTGISSAYMLFILGGSFGLQEKPPTPIGFLGEPKDNQMGDIPNAPLDFLKLGFFEELAGRIGQTIQLSPLDNTMLADILRRSPSSPFVKLQQQLMLESNAIEIDDELIYQLIDDNREAIEKFGVRGLYQAFNALPQISQALIAGVSECYCQKFRLTCAGLVAEVWLDYAQDEQDFLGLDELIAPTNHKSSSDNNSNNDPDWADLPF